MRKDIYTLLNQTETNMADYEPVKTNEMEIIRWKNTFLERKKQEEQENKKNGKERKKYIWYKAATVMLAAGIAVPTAVYAGKHWNIAADFFGVKSSDVTEEFEQTIKENVNSEVTTYEFNGFEVKIWDYIYDMGQGDGYFYFSVMDTTGKNRRLEGIFESQYDKTVHTIEEEKQWYADGRNYVSMEGEDEHMEVPEYSWEQVETGTFPDTEQPYFRLAYHMMDRGKTWDFTKMGFRFGHTDAGLGTEEVTYIGDTKITTPHELETKFYALPKPDKVVKGYRIKDVHTKNYMDISDLSVKYYNKDETEEWRHWAADEDMTYADAKLYKKDGTVEKIKLKRYGYSDYRKEGYSEHYYSYYLNGISRQEIEKIQIDGHTYEMKDAEEIESLEGE